MLPPDHTYINSVDHILMDMDGTILDRSFDDFFWEEHLPRIYGEKNAISYDEAAAFLLTMYREREGTLEWTDLDYWSRRLNLDIAALKEGVGEKITPLPYALEFLRHCRDQGKSLTLVTNAHPKTLKIKAAKTGIDRHFDKLICAAEIGTAKEEKGFWPTLFKKLGFTPAKCFLADDNHQVLSSAAKAGVEHLVEISRPSSRPTGPPSGLFPSVDNFSRLMKSNNP